MKDIGDNTIFTALGILVMEPTIELLADVEHMFPVL
jgi:hypothetical protein